MASVFTLSVRSLNRSLYHFLSKRTFAMSAESEDFFSCDMFAVVGASDDRQKFGNKVLRCYQQHNRVAVPISKRLSIIEGLTAVESLTQLSSIIASPQGTVLPNLPVKDVSRVGVSVITPPGVTKGILEEALEKGYKHIFLQPGTYDREVDAIIKSSKFSSLNIQKGCVLVELGFSEFH